MNQNVSTKLNGPRTKLKNICVLNKVKNTISDIQLKNIRCVKKPNMTQNEEKSQSKPTQTNTDERNSREEH